MQLTIDSNEPLDRILQVVGALYGVSLNADGSGAAQTAPTTSGRGRGGRGTRKSAATGRGRSASTSRGSRSGRGRGVSGAEVRQWARSNGYQVNERGPIPATLRDAYLAAQRG